MRQRPWRRVTVAVSLLVLSTLNATYSTVSDDTLKTIPRATEDFDIKNGALLSPLLRTRVPGSEGNAAARQHFIDFFRKTLPDWNIELQNSTQYTPVDGGKDLPFTNIIAYRDPPWAMPGDSGRLTLVAHYDSLITPEGFIGAIDSAAPCAMIMHTVRTLDKALARKWEKMQADGVDEFSDLEEQKGIQVLFLDGEEAFVSWSQSDSIYGARSLATQWDTEYHPAMSTYKSRLDSISLFVLLDLLGSGQYTPIPSWFKTTHWAYQNMAKLEARLRDLRVFQSQSGGGMWLNEADKSPDGSFQSYIMQDDHIPFIAKGVEVLHLIPSHFPSVWHNMNDDGEHLDMPTVEDWAILTTAFAAEWLELEGFFDAAPLPAAESSPSLSPKEKRNTKSVMDTT